MNPWRQLGKHLFTWLLIAAVMLAFVGCSLHSEDIPSAGNTVSATQIASTSVAHTDAAETSPTPSRSHVPAAETPWPSEEVNAQGYYTFNYEGTVREFLLYIPDGLEQDAPLVFMLHGYGGTAKQFQTLTGMDELADQYGFAVVYPQGLAGTDTYYSKACWNAGLYFTDADDVGFLTALAKYLQKRYQLSSEETFSAGFSNGGFMGYMLAVSAPETFKAVASVGGTMSREVWAERDTADTSVSILEIHGTGDRTIPVDGSLTESSGWGGAPPLVEIIEFWRNKYGLDNVSTFEVPPSTTVYRYDSGSSDCLVWYYEIEGLGHKWPTKDIAGFNASDVVWEFFTQLLE